MSWLIQRPWTGSGSLAWTLLLPALLLLSCGSGGSTEIVIFYEDASSLEAGNEVRMNDFAIGEIREVDIEPDGNVAVRVRMFPKYKDYVTEGSTFTVRRESLLSPGRFIEMQAGPGAPVDSGTRFEGQVSVEDRIKGLTDRFLDSLGSTDLKKTFEDLAASADSAARMGREQWEERRPEIEADARKLLEDLEREGNEAADRLRQRLEEYMKELEEEEKGGKSVEI